MSNNKTVLILFLALLITTQATANEGIELKKGKMFLDGFAYLKYEMKDFSHSKHKIAFHSDLGGGLFLADDWSLGVSLPTTWYFGKQLLGQVDVSLRSTYFFGKDILRPYVGLSLTPGYMLSERAFRLRLGPDMGLLVSLSKNIALDFTLRPELHFKLYPSQHWKISLLAGSFGVRALF